jgi:hypothetical protein
MKQLTPRQLSRWTDARLIEEWKALLKVMRHHGVTHVEDLPLFWRRRANMLAIEWGSRHCQLQIDYGNDSW